MNDSHKDIPDVQPSIYFEIHFKYGVEEIKKSMKIGQH